MLGLKYEMQKVWVDLNTHTHTQHTYTPVTAGVKWSINSCNYQVSSPSAPCRQWHASEGKIARACLRVTECHVVKWLVRKRVCQRFRVALRLTVQACACVCVCVCVCLCLCLCGRFLNGRLHPLEVAYLIKTILFFNINSCKFGHYF